jgi:hypothetical protein
MKILLLAILLVSSLSSWAQDYLYSTDSDTRNLVVNKKEEGLSVCQGDQEILYDRYLTSSRLQLGYLLEVITDEGLKNPNSFRHFSYMDLLREKVFQHILIDQLQKKMQKKTLFQLYLSADRRFQTSVMEMEGVKLELGEEISKTLSKVLSYRRFHEISIEHIEHELLKDTLEDLVKSAFKAVISGAAQKTLSKILAGTVTREAFKKAVVSTGLEMSSQILIGVAKSSLISALTLPLHGHRLSDEDMWIDLTEKAPMLLLNPDWKADDKNGGRAASDWQIHCRTMIWKPERVEYIFNKLVSKTEKNFYSKVEAVRTSVDFANPHSIFQQMPADGTYVRPKYLGPKL